MRIVHRLSLGASQISSGSRESAELVVKLVWAEAGEDEGDDASGITGGFGGDGLSVT